MMNLSFPVIVAFLYLADMSNASGFMVWTYLVQREVTTGALLMSLVLVGTGIFVVNLPETGKMTVKGIGTR